MNTNINIQKINRTTPRKGWEYAKERREEKRRSRQRKQQRR